VAVARLSREADASGSLLQALDTCHARGATLCSEAQWKACEPSAGSRPQPDSWLAALGARGADAAEGHQGAEGRASARGA